MGHAQEHRRHQAIARYLAGDPIEAICRDLHCAKSWLYKWKARYQADDPGWATRRSTQPRHTPNQTPQPVAQRIVTLHRTLGQSGQRGSAAAIQQALQQQGLAPVPSLRTISRLLQRHAQEAISRHPGLAAVHDLVVLLKGPRGHGAQARRPSVVRPLSTPGGHCHEQGNPPLATALGSTACLQGSAVLFASAIEVINTLAAAKSAGRLKAELKKYTKPALLILDELGYLPIDKTGADLLFQVIALRYEQGAIILTSHRAFQEWPAIFNHDSTLTSAVLDRWLHHADTIIIEGKSVRMKDQLER